MRYREPGNADTIEDPVFHSRLNIPRSFQRLYQLIHQYHVNSGMTIGQNVLELMGQISQEFLQYMPAFWSTTRSRQPTATPYLGPFETTQHDVVQIEARPAEYYLLRHLLEMVHHFAESFTLGPAARDWTVLALDGASMVRFLSLEVGTESAFAAYTGYPTPTGIWRMPDPQDATQYYEL
jgi:hypothetical protein